MTWLVLRISFINETTTRFICSIRIYKGCTHVEWIETKKWRYLFVDCWDGNKCETDEYKNQEGRTQNPRHTWPLHEPHETKNSRPKTQLDPRPTITTNITITKLPRSPSRSRQATTDHTKRINTHEPPSYFLLSLEKCTAGFSFEYVFLRFAYEVKMKMMVDIKE